MISCIICHLEITNEDGSSQGCPNGHFIHSDCLKDWLRDFSHCPLCGVPYSVRVILQSDKHISNRLKYSKVRWIKCPDCKRKLIKEEFFIHSCKIDSYKTGAQLPRSPVNLRRVIIRDLKRLFSRRTQSEQIVAQIPEEEREEENEEQRFLLSDKDVMILDLESEEGIKLMKQYEEEIGERAIHEGKETPSFVMWLKGEEVETLDARLLREREADLKRKQEHQKRKQEIFEDFRKIFEPSVYAKKNVERALERLAMVLSFRDKKINKELERILEKIKKLEDYDEDKYPYSVILKLFSGDNDYRRSFILGKRKRRGIGDDRYPYPYVFKPPEPPDDIVVAPRVQLHASPKKIDPEEKIHCQYCGMKLTKEEQLTHSCQKKPKNS